MDQLDGEYIDMIEAKEEHEERLLNKMLQDVATFLKDKFVSFTVQDNCFYLSNGQELSVNKLNGLSCIMFAEMSLGVSQDVFGVLININEYCQENGHRLHLI